MVQIYPLRMLRNMVLTKFKPHSPFSWREAIAKADLKREWRIKRCKDLKTVPPKPKPQRRQS